MRFHTYRNLEDILARELTNKLGISEQQLPTEPTNTGFVVVELSLSDLRELLLYPPVLWTVEKARVHLISEPIPSFEATETILEEALDFVAKTLIELGLEEVNCRIIQAGKATAQSTHVLLGIVERVLASHRISLLFRRKIPFLHINMQNSRCRIVLEIGRKFFPQDHFHVHHTPLSTISAYALLQLAIEAQEIREWNILDPMCGNGTVFYVAAPEARIKNVLLNGIGIDKDADSITNARLNLQGLENEISFNVGNIEDFPVETLHFTPNLLLTQPPYGFSPPMTPSELEGLYIALFLLFVKFPGSIVGVVTPHEEILAKLVQNYNFQTITLRRFTQKTLSSFIWIGQTPYES